MIRNSSIGSGGGGSGDMPGCDGPGAEAVPWAVENGSTLESERQPLEGSREKGGRGDGGPERALNTPDSQSKEDEDEEEEEEDEKEQPFQPLTLPGNTFYFAINSITLTELLI